MKMFDIDGNQVNIDVRPDTYPVKFKSRSSLQGMVGEKLEELFPYEPVLEDFTIPGSRMSVDFFLPRKRLVLEIQGRQHDEHVPFFHGDRATDVSFAKQKMRDSGKARWAEMNGFKFVEIRTKEDLETFNG